MRILRVHRPCLNLSLARRGAVKFDRLTNSIFVELHLFFVSESKELVKKSTGTHLQQSSGFRNEIEEFTETEVIFVGGQGSFLCH